VYRRPESRCGQIPPDPAAWADVLRSYHMRHPWLSLDDSPNTYTTVSVTSDAKGVDNDQIFPTRLEPTHCPNHNVAPAADVMQAC
jgi:hypothetical protein